MLRFVLLIASPSKHWSGVVETKKGFSSMEEFFNIGAIPAVLYGYKSGRL